MDILHATRVAGQLIDVGESSNVVMAGFLHDAIEDEELTFNQIEHGINVNVAYMVLGMTRRKAETYNNYIDRVADDRVLTVIKVADLQDNLGRMDEEHASLKPRYTKALRQLNQALWEMTV